MVLVDEWRYADRTLRVAVILTAVTFLVIAISFGTPYWLISVPNEQVPEPKFVKLGLWAVCMNGYFDMRHQYDERFYGCKHILLEEYDIIRSEIQTPFMVATQVFFTFCLMGTLVALILIGMYMLCINDYYRVSVLRWTGIDLIISATIGAIALIIFGAKADGRDFMPDWENNYLSWSYGLGAVGVILEAVCGILFLVEARIMLRKERAMEKYQQRTEERTV